MLVTEILRCENCTFAHSQISLSELHSMGALHSGIHSLHRHTERPGTPSYTMEWSEHSKTAKDRMGGCHYTSGVQTQRRDTRLWPRGPSSCARPCSAQSKHPIQYPPDGRSRPFAVSAVLDAATERLRSARMSAWRSISQSLASEQLLQLLKCRCPITELPC